MVLIKNLNKPANCLACPFWLNTWLCDHSEITCPLIEVDDTERYKCKTITRNNSGQKFQVVIKPDGENELDPCDYELVDKRNNCVVEVMRCRKCGHEEIWWTDKDRHPECLDEDED